MKVGTDFSGIGSPEMALKLLGIKHQVEFACEIDKYARKSYEAMYGKPKRFYEDITKRDHSEVPQLDLYVAGFPCQAFSMAGKRLGFEEARGTLFFNVADFIRVNQPKMFILENVKGLLSHDGGKTFETIKSILSDNGGTVNSQQSIPYFDDGLGYHIYHQVLNTKDFGIPQNRERIFIVGFKDFREFSFPKPFPLELRLKDMLEDEVDDKYFLSEKMINYISKDRKGNDKLVLNREGANTITCEVKKMQRSTQDNYWVADYRNDEGLRIRKDGNSPCMTARRHSETDLSSMPPIIGGVKQLNPSKESGGQQPYQQNRVFDINGLSPAVLANLGGDRNHNINTEQIRRLTPLECWRLQAYPDDSFYKAQEVNIDTQLYKQAGNSISVNVMMKIIEKL